MSNSWSFPLKWVFLTVGIFLFLHSAVAFLQHFDPGVVGSFWDTCIDLLNRYIVRMDAPISLKPNGSGDTTWHWMHLLATALLAFAGGTLWAVLDRRRAHYAGLNFWLLIILRYFLIYQMFGYGFAKVFMTQFPAPNLIRLTETYGDSSPMGLAWAFMGYSEGYNWFTGGAEVLAGMLLLWRRTTTLGALVGAGVMANVAVMNFCYDIPVKIFSSLLFLMFLYILINDLQRLANVFVLNRPAPAADIAFPKKPRWLFWPRTGLKTLFIGAFVLSVAQQLGNQREAMTPAPVPPLRGWYHVAAFSGAPDPWREVAVDGYRGYSMADVRLHRDTSLRYALQVDSAQHSLRLSSRFDTTAQYRFAYDMDSLGNLTLRGIPPTHDSLRIRLMKKKIPAFTLNSRGFHWVNEYPLNR